MKTKLPKIQIERLVTEAWRTLEAACDKAHDPSKVGTPDRFLSRAEDEATRGERAPRAMGARFTHGQAGYRVSVQCAARAIIIHHVFFGMGGAGGNRRPRSWSEAAAIRQDCALAYAIREHLDKATLAKLEAAARIDYAEDIAA